MNEMDLQKENLRLRKRIAGLVKKREKKSKPDSKYTKDVEELFDDTERIIDEEPEQDFS